MNKRLLTAAAATCTFIGAAHAADWPGGIPAPGSYRVDSEATMTVRGTDGSRVQRTDGATGAITVTMIESNRVVHTQHFPGTRPDVRCVAPAVPPPWATAHACQGMTHQFGATTATLQGQCNVGAINLRWTRIDERTWDLVYDQSLSVGSPAQSSPQAAIDIAAAGMPPAQRAKLLAGVTANLPSDAQRLKAMKDLRDKLEATARGSNANEAAAARTALQSLDAGPAGVGGGGFVTRVQERWMRVAEACAAP